ncbi:histidine phosphatase family protein [Streptomyces sp. ITFR-6]|uniref:histidine phosphatase family protein n=1 Tax=Streptomyces sp. ITFR-6 TaxID=3075197 RepID=UPI00288A39D6|nr:histidine phosphatase family protein [Streptomyces sp. ITFR-6]WNI27687.1 histidine phosphatase family protein [Streptomyces sp. ITFR-6]
MTVRVMLISPAMNAALREARFAGDSPLDASGLRQARSAAGAVPAADRCLRGPSLRCAATADALGLRSDPEPALRDWEMGRWSGARLTEVSADEPDGVTAWLTDPSAAPHGGESLLELCARVGAWLDSSHGRQHGSHGSDGSHGSHRSDEGHAGDGGPVLAVAEPAVIRAATVHALELPPQAFWRLDVAPLTVTELSGRSGRWNLRCGRPLSPESGN